MKNDLKSAVNDLVNNSIFIIGVGIGTGINPTDLNIITREVQHTLIVGVNKSPGELAGDIMDIIELGIRSEFTSFSFQFELSKCRQISAHALTFYISHCSCKTSRSILEHILYNLRIRHPTTS